MRATGSVLSVRSSTVSCARQTAYSRNDEIDEMTIGRYFVKIAGLSSRVQSQRDAFRAQSVRSPR